MILFYTSEIINNKALLTEDEFQHCCKVLRHKEGDIIQITNGQGIFAEARIDNVQKRQAELSILSQQSIQNSSTIIELAVAPPKTKTRWEWLLEKSVEVGVDVISPIITSNIERNKINLERNKKIIRSAALQSKRIIHPRMNEIIKLGKYLDKEEVKNATKILCHYNEDNPHIHESNITNNHLIVFIGPEGDFSQDEVDILKNHKSHLVNISNNRLRTETAAIIAVSQLNEMTK